MAKQQPWTTKEVMTWFKHLQQTKQSTRPSEKECE